LTHPTSVINRFDTFRSLNNTHMHADTDRYTETDTDRLRNRPIHRHMNKDRYRQMLNSLRL